MKRETKEETKKEMKKETKTTEAQRKAVKKYKEKVKRITIDFAPTEADLLAQIEKQPKKQTYIKDLIRADMNK